MFGTFYWVFCHVVSFCTCVGLQSQQVTKSERLPHLQHLLSYVSQTVDSGAASKRCMWANQKRGIRKATAWLVLELPGWSQLAYSMADGSFPFSVWEGDQAAEGRDSWVPLCTESFTHCSDMHGSNTSNSILRSAVELCFVSLTALTCGSWGIRNAVESASAGAGRGEASCCFFFFAIRWTWDSVTTESKRLLCSARRQLAEPLRPALP